MCGLIGYFSKKPLNENFSIKSHLDSFAYRGPDSQKIYKNNANTFFLGFNRLSIIDLSENGNQPFEDINNVTAANCEIYNFKKLKKDLQNYKFKSESDSEVILHGYSKWGNDVFEKLEGMFSINIYNKKNHTLTLARDRFGIKPIFYYLDEEKLIFSSEFIPLIKLLKYLTIGLDINNESLENFFFGPYNFSSNTLINKVKKLDPGCYLQIDKDFNINIKKYWKYDSDLNLTEKSFKNSCDEFENLIINSIDKHLVSDVPIATLYSGGLDSSLITKLASMRNKQIISITANFDNQFSEREIFEMKEFNKNIGIKNHLINLDTKNVIKNIENDIEIFDDLSSSDPGFLTNQKLSKEIKKLNIKVVLVGDGADEMFSGYSWYGLGKYPFKILPEKIKDLLYFYSVSRTMDIKNGYHVFDRFKKSLIKNKSYDKKITINEIFKQLPNNYLSKVDRSTMRSSVEARVPYLDNEIFNFSIKLNSNFKLKGNFYSLKSFNKPNEKYILREISKKYLSTKIINKKKFGYSFKLYDVIKDNLNLFRETLNKNDAIINNYFDKNKISKKINNINNATYHPFEIYNHLILWKFFLYENWKNKIKL